MRFLTSYKVGDDEFSILLGMFWIEQGVKGGYKEVTARNGLSISGVFSDQRVEHGEDFPLEDGGIITYGYLKRNWVNFLNQMGYEVQA